MSRALEGSLNWGSQVLGLTIDTKKAFAFEN